MLRIDLISRSLLIAVTALSLCQVFKVIFYSIKNKKPELHYLISPGGMPSTHSAFVTALTFSLGFSYGFNTDLFAVSFVFAGIIVHDSFRLRGTVEIHSRILKNLLHLVPEDKKEKIPMVVGHTFPEIVAGVIVGIVSAYFLDFVFI
jgi:acid phosphatase family membrane protein YuiD